MVDLGFADILSLAQTIAIIATLALTFYFSRRQIQSLAIDVETRVLNDLDEKIHRLGEVLIERPQMLKVIYNDPTRFTPEVIFAHYVLYICSHAYHMRQRKIISDNEWEGWILYMKNVFQYGTLKRDWKELQIENWFDPSFTKFINEQILKSNVSEDKEV